MENVPEVIGKGNVKHFNKWLTKLESLGYSNYFQILNGKDYCIPQNRRRVFMISILGDYAYDFPLKHKLKYRLKDFLCKSVDEKYYLDEKDIERISSWNAYEKPLENAIDPQDISSVPCLTTHVGKDSAGMKLVKVGNYGNGHHAKDVIDSNGLSTTITTGNHGLGHAIVDKKVERESDTMNLRIRKLVPLETCKLMGFERKDYQAMRDIGMSDSQIYHCCGDSIVTTCLMALFGQMLFDEETLKEKIEKYADSLKEANNEQR